MGGQEYKKDTISHQLSSGFNLSNPLHHLCVTTIPICVRCTILFVGFWTWIWCFNDIPLFFQIPWFDHNISKMFKFHDFSSVLLKTHVDIPNLLCNSIHLAIWWTNTRILCNLFGKYIAEVIITGLYPKESDTEEGWVCQAGYVDLWDDVLLSRHQHLLYSRRRWRQTVHDIFEIEG